MDSERSGIVRVNPIPFTAAYAWSVGIPMEKFIKALAEKKLLASKCPSCGYVYAPPRNRCGKCSTVIGDKDILELSGKGTLLGYTAAQVKLDGAGNFQDLEKPEVIGAVKLEGADSTVFMLLDQADPKDLKPGLKVEVEWAAETKGALSDLKAFKVEKAKKK
jgi:hypothetical protein